MTPFQKFREWRRQSNARRVGSIVVPIVVVVAIVLAVALPGNGDSSSTKTATASDTPASAASADTLTSTPPLKGCAKGSGDGVSAEELQIGIVLIDLNGGADNSLFGVPSTDQEQKAYDSVIAATNAAGGAACRKIVPHYYKGNPIDASSLHALCLELAQDKLFAAFDAGAFYAPAARGCVPQNKLPLITTGILSRSEIDQYSPYLIGEVAAYDTLYRDTVLAAHGLGMFDTAKGFAKAGLLVRSCTPDNPNDVKGLLEQLEVPMSTYDVGCPDVFASPEQLTQAALQFKNDGVTLVLTVDTAATEMPGFTKISQKQGFHPTYLVADDGAVAPTQTDLSRPDPDNFDGSIAVTNERYGEENSDLPAEEHTDACNTIMTGAGLPDVREQKVGFGGIACNQIAMLVAAVSHTSTISQAGLAAGLAKAGGADRSFPDGPADFRASKGAVAGQFWRTLQWHKDCGCWRVLDKTWHPNHK